MELLSLFSHPIPTSLAEDDAPQSYPLVTRVNRAVCSCSVLLCGGDGLAEMLHAFLLFAMHFCFFSGYTYARCKINEIIGLFPATYARCIPRYRGCTMGSIPSCLGSHLCEVQNN